ncbi:hypothetical protein J4526_07035 [Desulfurococcaceae archaeon MEX13E-LK6-19]|nr:hypothetical protein J4526_07035 [Desulfurococcaceae archaeon MEX13E-LK6-19]
MGYEYSTGLNSLTIFCAVVSIIVFVFFEIYYVPLFTGEEHNAFEVLGSRAQSSQRVFVEKADIVYRDSIIELKIVVAFENIPVWYLESEECDVVIGIKVFINGTSVEKYYAPHVGFSYDRTTGKGRLFYTYPLSYTPFVKGLRNTYNITVFLNTTAGLFKYSVIKTLVLEPPVVKKTNSTFQIVNNLPFPVEVEYNVTLVSNETVVGVLNETTRIYPGRTWTYTPYYTGLIDKNIVRIRIVCEKINYVQEQTIVVSRQ